MLCARTAFKVCHFSNKTMSLLYIHLYMLLFLSHAQDGATPLFIASQHGHSNVVNILIKNGAGVNMAKKVRKIL